MAEIDGFEAAAPVCVPSGRKSSFGVDVLKLASGATLSQAIGILLSPVLSRLFPPEAYGTTAVFTAILDVIDRVSCLRYESALMLPEKDEDAAHLAVGSLLLLAGTTLLTAVAVLLLGERVARWLNAPDLAGYLWLLPPSVAMMGAYVIVRQWNTRRRRFGLLAGARVASTAGVNLYRLAGGLLGYNGPGALIASRVFASLGVAGGLGWWTWRESGELFAKVKLAGIAAGLKEYRKFPLVSTWSSLLSMGSAQAPVMLLSLFFSQSIVGYYSMGMRMVHLPMILIGGAIEQVFFQSAARARNEGNLGRLVLTTYRRMVNVGLYPLLALGLIGRDVFLVVLGPSWAEAGLYAQILSLSYLTVFVVSPFACLGSVLQKQEVSLLFNVSLAVSVGASFLAGGWLGNVYLALTLYAASGILLRLALAAWALRVSGVPPGQVFRSFGRGLARAAGGLLLLAAGRYWWGWASWSLLIVACLGAALYYGLVVRGEPALRASVTTQWGRFTRRVP